ncbi:MAG: magnesium-translocating P-type ATPase [Candidatus Falkowbacteria bacterium]|nr:magnesium-translocating P-type ATPase [Candidatus Falkowbacteria bacterium]
MAEAKKYQGLSSSEAILKLKQFGPNIITKQKRFSSFVMFFKKLTSPLFLLMISISVVSFVIGQRTSAIFVIMMVILSAVFDFINSYKSQKVVEKLATRVSTKVTILRDGKKQELPLADVVPDDILFLSAGNIIPADCQLVESDDFFVDQSALTGESMPCEKVASNKRINKNNTAEDENVIFMGTSVVSGFGTALVLKTGKETKFGKIAGELDKAEPKTNFEISITKFSLFIMRLVFYMVSFVLMVYLIKNFQHLNKNSILEAITFSLAVTLGVTPDMLPAIITFCLSRGSKMMAKKKVIVKHLSSIENFGSMDILCTDKTGTLTQNHISLVKYTDYEGKDSAKVLEFGRASSYFHTGIQNPMDNAINEYQAGEVVGFEKIDEIPYDFERRRSSMVVKKDDKKFLITKGAPEAVISICNQYELDNKIVKDKSASNIIQEKFENLSKDGFRVLALCYKEIIADDSQKSFDKNEENNMTFIGFLSFLDPAKETVKQTIVELEQLGVEIKILTGDNELLSEKICRDIGLDIKGTITGEEMEKLNDDQLSNKLPNLSIFARIDPIQKERIILILKKAGKTVGFLGDGINDAPALRAADVGVSVNNAVDIAKETADIILLEKNLETLKDGVIEGRKTFHNTLKYILMGLSSNFGNMFSMMGAATFLPFLPMLPGQILFNNFIYDASQFSLPTDTVDEDELLKPTHWDLGFVKKYMLVFGWISSLFDFLTFFLLFSVYHLGESQFQTGWFIESIATQILVIYIIRTKKIPFIKSRPSKALLITTLSAVAIAWIIPFTFLGRIMGFGTLPISLMAFIFGYVLIYLGIVEIAKRIFYHQHNKRLQKTLRAA